jgi:hypothetical protein
MWGLCTHQTLATLGPARTTVNCHTIRRNMTGLIKKAHIAMSMGSTRGRKRITSRGMTSLHPINIG